MSSEPCRGAPERRVSRQGARGSRAASALAQDRVRVRRARRRRGDRRRAIFFAAWPTNPLDEPRLPTPRACRRITARSPTVRAACSSCGRPAHGDERHLRCSTSASRERRSGTPRAPRVMPAATRTSPCSCPTATGGVIVAARRDFRNGVTGDIYAQRIDATSTPAEADQRYRRLRRARRAGVPVIVSDERTLSRPGR